MDRLSDYLVGLFQRLVEIKPYLSSEGRKVSLSLS